GDTGGTTGGDTGGTTGGDTGGTTGGDTGGTTGGDTGGTTGGDTGGTTGGDTGGTTGGDTGGTTGGDTGGDTTGECTNEADCNWQDPTGPGGSGYQRQGGGFGEVWARRLGELSQTPLMQVGQRLVPEIPAGRAPDLSVRVAVPGVFDLGVWSIQPPDWVWHVGKVFVLGLAGLAAFRIITA
ncbi:MAG: hypothetical protein LDL26_00365, partial [Caenispirillum bisanense]|nr:hypothetical protein [Caenispirillum bisanense]